MILTQRYTRDGAFRVNIIHDIKKCFKVLNSFFINGSSTFVRSHTTPVYVKQPSYDDVAILTTDQWRPTGLSSTEGWKEQDQEGIVGAEQFHGVHLK